MQGLLHRVDHLSLQRCNTKPDASSCCEYERKAQRVFRHGQVRLQVLRARADIYFTGSVAVHAHAHGMKWMICVAGLAEVTVFGFQLNRREQASVGEYVYAGASARLRSSEGEGQSD